MPEGAIGFIRNWLKPYRCAVRITKARESKLGDYRAEFDGSHSISVNGDLAPQLFFFVLTHEIAHLIAFTSTKKRIRPHGSEWKEAYKKLLLESLEIYREDFRPLVLAYAAAPKANYVSNPDIVRYFQESDGNFFLEDLPEGSTFLFRDEPYHMQQRLKKRYICKHLRTGVSYYFKACTRVAKHTE